MTIKNTLETIQIYYKIRYYTETVEELALKEQMTKYGKCKLCCSQKELKESHIISSFLFKWLKRTSVTGYIRSGETPNQRKQDGWKLFLLCEDCEKLFSKWERCFAKNILEPITKEEQIKPYGSWLLKFSTSLSWRILQFAKKERPLDHFSNSLISSAKNASTVWREFLLDKRPNPGRFEHHMLLFPELITEYRDDLPQNINQYILRSIDIDVPCSKKEAFIYLKVGRIFIFGFIKIQNPKNWPQTKIHVKNGTLLNKHYKIPKKMQISFSIELERDSRLSRKCQRNSGIKLVKIMRRI